MREHTYTGARIFGARSSRIFDGIGRSVYLTFFRVYLLERGHCDDHAEVPRFAYAEVRKLLLKS